MICTDSRRPSRSSAETPTACWREPADEGGQGFLAAFGGRLEGVGAEQGGDQLQLGGVGPFQGGVQGDGQVPALAPGEPVGEDDHAAVQQQDVPGRLVGGEQPAGELGAGLDPLPAADLDRRRGAGRAPSASKAASVSVAQSQSMATTFCPA